MRILSALVLAALVAPAALAQHSHAHTHGHDHVHSHGDIRHGHPHSGNHHSGGATWTIPSTPAARAAEVARLDRRIRDLDAQIASLTSRIENVRMDLSSSSTPSAHADYDRALSDFNRDFAAHSAESSRVRAMYDQIRRYGASDAQRRAYERDVYQLEDESQRLAGESAMLETWAAEIGRDSQVWVEGIQTSAQQGRMLSMQRLDLRHERWMMAQRRDRIAARGYTGSHGHAHSGHAHDGHRH